MKKVTKVFSVMVASVALAAMLSGCGGDKKPAGGDTIKVGGNLERRQCQFWYFFEKCY